MFQSVTRNPLGSPDVIGLGAGAAAGAAAAGLVWPGVVPVPVGALIGAGVAIGAVYLGSGARVPRAAADGRRRHRRRRDVAGVRAAGARPGRPARTRRSLAAYLNGSLASRAWSDVGPHRRSRSWCCCPLALVLTRPMQLVEMGDEVAVAVGVQRGPGARRWAVVVGVLLTAAAVDRERADRVRRADRPADRPPADPVDRTRMVAAACCGAAVLVVADLVAQYAVPGVVYPVGRRHRRARRRVPRVPAGPRVEEEPRVSSRQGPPLARRGPDARLRPARRRPGPVRADPARLVHRDHRPQRLRQVDAAAGARSARSSHAPGGCCSTGAPISSHEEQGRRPPARAPAAEPDRARVDHRRRPRRPRPVPAPGAAAAVVGRRRAGRSRTRSTPPRSPTCADRLRRRAVRRPAPAGVARDGARAADRPAAARRADDVPRHRPPVRGDGPVRAAARGGPHARRRAARPQPGRPVRHPPHRHEGRARSSPRARRRTSSRSRWCARCSGCACRVVPDPETGTPMVVPARRDAHVRH